EDASAGGNLRGTAALSRLRAQSLSRALGERQRGSPHLPAFAHARRAVEFRRRGQRRRRPGLGGAIPHRHAAGAAARGRLRTRERLSGSGLRRADCHASVRTVTRPTTLVVLARTRRGTTRRLLRAARARGLSPRFLDPAACTAYVDGQRSRLLHRGKRVGEVELVVPRLRTVSSHALAVLHHLETAGAHVLNSAEAISRASPPMPALQLLA